MSISAATTFYGLPPLGLITSNDDEEAARLSSTFQATTTGQDESEKITHLTLNPYAKTLRQQALETLSSNTGKALNLMINALEELKDQAPELAQALFKDFIYELNQGDYKDIANLLSHNYEQEQPAPAQAYLLA